MQARARADVGARASRPAGSWTGALVQMAHPDSRPARLRRAGGRATGGSAARPAGPAALCVQGRARGDQAGGRGGGPASRQCGSGAAPRPRLRLRPCVAAARGRVRRTGFQGLPSCELAACAQGVEEVITENIVVSAKAVLKGARPRTRRVRSGRRGPAPRRARGARACARSGGRRSVGSRAHSPAPARRLHPPGSQAASALRRAGRRGLRPGRPLAMRACHGRHPLRCGHGR